MMCQRYGSGDPDPHQNVTDPQHWCKEHKSTGMFFGSHRYLCILFVVHAVSIPLSKFRGFCVHSVKLLCDCGSGFCANAPVLRIPGCLSRIRLFSIPDPGSRSKYFNPKNWFLKLLEIWSRLFIPDPGVKKAPDPDPQHCNSLVWL